MSASPTDALPPRCTECGALLAPGMLPDGVVVVDGVEVPFRRETDFLVCERCLTTYRVEDVRHGQAHPV